MEIIKKGFVVLITSLFLMSMLSFGIAANVNEKNVTPEVAKEVKNMTYGQCVSAGALVKNDCYSAVKTTADSCNQNATEKVAKAQCNNEYKKAKDQCKTDFKAVKNECKKIKHNFFETVRYSLA